MSNGPSVKLMDEGGNHAIGCLTMRACNNPIVLVGRWLPEYASKQSHGVCLDVFIQALASSQQLADSVLEATRPAR